MDIRKILDVIDNMATDSLMESRGLGARKRGEIFKSTSDDSEIYFRVVRFWPEGGGKYDNQVLMQEEINSIQESMGDVKIQWTNRMTAQDLAFGVALFDTPDGDILAFGRYFRSVKANPMENSWENKTGIPGYQYASVSAQKTSAGMTPQDILKEPDNVNLTIHDIADKIEEKFGPDSSLTLIARKVAAGESYPIVVPAEENFTAFRDYFCELLQPMALVTGMFSGNAGEAAATFLGPNGFSDCDISFGGSKNQGLSDSIMVNPLGKYIKVSSKGAKGATASVKNLLDEFEKAKLTDDKIVKKHKRVVDLISRIKESGQNGAPLVLGVEYGIIDASDAEIIKSFRDQPLGRLDDLLKTPKMSAKLKKLVKERNANDTLNMSYYYHCMAAVAHAAVEKVNESGDFSKAAVDILNNGALIQVYTKARQSKDQWILEGFDTVYPSKTVTGVQLSASKTYYSTGIKGNFTFEILYNGAKPSTDTSQEDTVSVEQPEIRPVRSSAAKANLAKFDSSSKPNLGREER